MMTYAQNNVKIWGECVNITLPNVMFVYCFMSCSLFPMHDFSVVVKDD